MMSSMSSMASVEYMQFLTTLAALLRVGLIVAGSIVFAILAPIIGCLCSGIDRKISARMQGRVGPPILQPYYDVRKLLAKDKKNVNGSENTYITFALVFAILAGGIFFSGGNILLCVFVLTLSSLLFIMAAYSSRSPYSEVGAAREILQVLSYEPTVLLMTVGFYMCAFSFNVDTLLELDYPIICYTWPIFICLVFIMIIKFRKSPFDISMSHHAHQEIVRGMTTEMSGRTLAKVEIMHWCENVLFMGWIAMFFVYSNLISIAIGVGVAALVYFLMIWIDNNFARVKWQAMIKTAWIGAIVLCGVNLGVLMFI